MRKRGLRERDDRHKNGQKTCMMGDRTLKRHFQPKRVSNILGHRRAWWEHQTHQAGPQRSPVVRNPGESNTLANITLWFSRPLEGAYQHYSPGLEPWQETLHWPTLLSGSRTLAGYITLANTTLRFSRNLGGLGQTLGVWITLKYYKKISMR